MTVPGETGAVRCPTCGSYNMAAPESCTDPWHRRGPVEHERFRQALEALVFCTDEDGAIYYPVSDFAIAILNGATVDEAVSG